MKRDVAHRTVYRRHSGLRQLTRCSGTRKNRVPHQTTVSLGDVSLILAQGRRLVLFGVLEAGKHRKRWIRVEIPWRVALECCRGRYSVCRALGGRHMRGGGRRDLVWFEEKWFCRRDPTTRWRCSRGVCADDGCSSRGWLDHSFRSRHSFACGGRDWILLQGGGGGNVRLRSSSLPGHTLRTGDGFRGHDADVRLALRFCQSRRVAENSFWRPSWDGTSDRRWGDTRCTVYRLTLSESRGLNWTFPNTAMTPVLVSKLKASVRRVDCPSNRPFLHRHFLTQGLALTRRRHTVVTRISTVFGNRPRIQLPRQR